MALATYWARAAGTLNSRRYKAGDKVDPRDLAALRRPALKVMYESGRLILADDGNVLAPAMAALTVDTHHDPGRTGR